MQVNTTISDGEEQCQSPEATESNSTVWSARKPTTIDNDATKLFLELRKKYKNKFDDKKTVKSQIWALIAQEMNIGGYYVGEKKEAIEKCRMKFANLQRNYLNYWKHVSTTGGEKRDPPPFFEEMHDILGTKDKIFPKLLQDSEMDMAEENNTNETLTENDSRVGPSTSQGCSPALNRFKRSQLTPKSNTDKIIEILKQQYQETSQERKEHFKSIETLIDTQNKQRDRLLNQFDKLIRIEQAKLCQDKNRCSSSSDEN